MKKNSRIVNQSIICAALTTAFFMGAVRAEDKNSQAVSVDEGLRSSYTECLDKSGGVTVRLLDCNTAEFEYQDQRLNKIYKSLAESLGIKELPRLRAEERKWIRYRDSQCSPDPESGTAADVDSSGCKVDQTARRANALEARLRK